MKALKKLLVLLISIIALILIVALFVDGDIKVSKSVQIDASVSDVYNYVSKLKNQDNYSVWQKMDPNMEKTYSGEDGTVGFISAWKSDNENVGSGEQEITKLVANREITCELRFKEPFEANNTAHFYMEPQGNSSTKISWEFEGGMPWPSNIMLLFMDMEKTLGEDLQTGLQNLKKIIEEEQGLN